MGLFRRIGLLTPHLCILAGLAALAGSWWRIEPLASSSTGAFVVTGVFLVIIGLVTLGWGRKGDNVYTRAYEHETDPEGRNYANETHFK